MDEATATPGRLGRLTAGVRDTGRTLGSVFANPNLRRVQLAFFGSAIGDRAYATALTVWAFRDGGAAAVGIFQAARFIAMAVSAPLGAVIADKVSRKKFMMVADLTRAVLVVLATACIALHYPSILVYALGLVAAVVGAPFRSAQAGLIPQLARTPEELTASNATASNLDNIALFAGPTLGALLIAVADVEVVFLINAATFVYSFALVLGIRVPAAAGPDAVDGDVTEHPPLEHHDSFLHEISAGFRTIVSNRDLGAVSLLAASQGLVWGALNVLMVIMALRLLGTGPQGVGYLDAVMGVATVIGGGVVLARVRKKRIAGDMVLGVIGWAVPLLAIAAFPSAVTALAALAVIGLADPLVNLGFDTIPQRVIADRVLSRVFGALESGLVGAMALGAFLSPLLVHLVGFRASLALIGALTTLVAVSCVPHMRRLDGRLVAPPGLPLIEALPLFAPLGPATQEQLAHALRALDVPAGEVVVREGDVADGFFIVESGLVEVTQGARVLRREGPGEFFGEIGLLRGVPRTATVTAVEDTSLRVLDRRSFLDAVSGHRDARSAAEEIASRRLAV